MDSRCRNRLTLVRADGLQAQWHQQRCRGPPLNKTLAVKDVDRYDPSQAPDPEVWLALDEQERMLLVEHYHRRARIKLPNVTVHATIHAAVENQLAANDEPIVRALARVMKQGLSRHDAIHAIGSVVAVQIYDALKLKETPETLRARYYAAIERLTAAEWFNSNDG